MRVHARLVRPPVEVGAPPLDHRPQVGGGCALRPLSARPLGGVAGAGEAIAQVVQRDLRNLDLEGLDDQLVRGVRHAQKVCSIQVQNVPQSTSSRLLLLLGYLQSQPVWSGPDLVALLGVSDRTLRKDVERLRELGYPVDATRGPGGGYRLGRHGQLPPLLLSDDEAVAVAIGLGSAGSAPGLADASASAMAKLERTLPDRLQRRVRAIHASTDVGPANTGTNEPEVPVDPDRLVQLAAAISDRTGIRFTYEDAERPVTADPYRLVSWQQRWYLVAREHPDCEWRVFRVDWMRLRFPGAARFAPEPLRGDD